MTYTTRAGAGAPNNSSLALFSMNGTEVLRYSVPAGTAARPTSGTSPPVGTLNTKKGGLLVGSMLGTDYMFMVSKHPFGPVTVSRWGGRCCGAGEGRRTNLTKVSGKRLFKFAGPRACADGSRRRAHA
eukprot:SAG11_NODE_2803_length_2954_cov_1.849737_1_plen_128_part_00